MLARGQRDAFELLEIVMPDAGTKGRNRYALAHCHCGCRARNIEVRIDNFLAGTASCPARRKAANRRAMERKEYLNKIKLVNALYDGKNLPQEAKEAAIRFARKVSGDQNTQAKIRQTWKADIAKRDIERCKAVLAEHTSSVESPPNQRPEPSPESFSSILADIGMKPLSVMLEKHGLIGPYNKYTEKGKAYFKWLREQISASATSTPKPPVPAPDTAKSPIGLRDVPFWQTEAGHDATQAYVNEFHQMPAEGFDLESYWKNYRAQFRRNA